MRTVSQIAIVVLLTTTLSLFFLNVFISSEFNDLKKTVYENKINKENVIVDYTKIIDEVSASIVSISDNPNNLLDKDFEEANLSGVIVSETGLIITTKSKIKNIDEIYVKLPSAGFNPVKGKYLTGDEKLDIAAIKIDVSDIELYPVKFAEKNYREGIAIAVISNSVGSDYIGKVVPGIITSLNSKIEANDKEHNLIEVSAPIDSENTGGVICNSKGEVIGIASDKLSKDIGKNGLYYAVDVEELGYLINSSELMKKKLGVTGGVITDEHINEKGFYIQSVDKNSNANKIGIKPTNIILSIDDNKINSTEDIISAIENKKAGDTIKCTVKNEGELKEVSIQIEA